ncbi:MAG: sn-glycerol-3-phosphate ABC transporter ATP-binding protein UgpC [Limnohabitans sp.]|nr:sn-glycerol-3-phosphate ABC transporter ATP-binding protein UgpC [Limnohabitans sp.]
MSTLELHGITKSFGNTAVIHHIDLQVRHGEFVVFVGPSGCGKSTLLRMIAGLEDTTSGDIRIDSEVVNAVSAADRGCAMVFQSYALYPHMSVYDNMAFGLENIGTDKHLIEQKVQEAAKLLRLDNHLDRKPTQLSGGQRQRVAIGRAIVREPKIFLFDEPLSNLDAELRVSMRSELRELHQRLGATMIYVTHDQVEAMTMADRIVVIRQGQIEQVGSPQELYEQPANTFVAGFIGSPRMNFIPAQSVAGKLDPHFNAPHNLHTIGIRPEHWVPSDAQQGLAVTVTNTEYMGSQTLVQGGLPDGTKIEALLANTAPPAVHQTIYFTTSAAHMHAFDAQGNALGRQA